MFILVYYIFRVYLGLDLLFSERHKCDELTIFLYCALELHCNYIQPFHTEHTSLFNTVHTRLFCTEYTGLLLSHILTSITL